MSVPEGTKKLSIRPARTTDIPAITAIVNHYILETVLTFATEPKTPAEMGHTLHEIESAGLPFLVACEQQERQNDVSAEREDDVVGYSYVTGFRDERPAYRSTLELSLFCHPAHVRKGIGKQLLCRMVDVLTEPEREQWLIGDRLLRHPPREVLAVMAVDIDGPESGLGLRDWYLRYGFTLTGHLRNVGFKKDRWVDVLFLQLSIRRASSNA